ncbi:hypothetical protein AX14_010268, partial [Amanita brunnescens Koide BX004]
MLDAPAQDQGDSRELNCLIEGESNVLQVIVAIHKKVGDLQEAIKSRAAHTFKNVDSYNVVLCKVDIDLNTHDDHSLSRLVLESIEKEKLQSWKSILHYWPDQPRNDDLHVIIKAPVPFDTFRTPRQFIQPACLVSPPTDAGHVMKRIDEFLENLRPKIEVFLANPQLPLWEPPETVDQL